MDAVISGKECCISNLNIHPINHFYSDFPINTSIMENQIKNRKNESSNSKEETSNIPLSRTAHQIILGSLLGDMHCKREFLNSNIEETHSIKQKDYLKWKYINLQKHLDLKLYFLNNPICKANGKTYSRKEGIRLRSKVSKKLNIYRELFYKNNKKIINNTILYQLNTLGLAVWYCDDGYYDPANKTVEIHTEGFSIDENLLIKKWFKEKWNISINFKKDPSKNKILLRLPVNESNKFLNLIETHVFKMPESIWYKLGHKWDGNKYKIYNAKINKSRRNKIYQSRAEVKIIRNQQSREFYKKNLDKILKRVAQYRKTDRYKTYIRQYTQMPSVKKRIKLAQKKYRTKPEYKIKASLYRKEYRKRPEVIEKIRLYNKKVRDRRSGGDKN